MLEETKVLRRVRTVVVGREEAAREENGGARDG